MDRDLELDLEELVRIDRVVFDMFDAVGVDWGVRDGCEKDTGVDV